MNDVEYKAVAQLLTALDRVTYVPIDSSDVTAPQDVFKADTALRKIVNQQQGLERMGKLKEAAKTLLYSLECYDAAIGNCEALVHGPTEFPEDIGRIAKALANAARDPYAMEQAPDIALRYGAIDGGHHKTWVIDQMIRALLENDDAYTKWCAESRAGEDGPETYAEWPTGIAP